MGLVKIDITKEDWKEIEDTATELISKISKLAFGKTDNEEVSEEDSILLAKTLYNDILMEVIEKIIVASRDLWNETMKILAEES